MLAALVFRELLLEQVHQRVVYAVLLEVGAGDARRVLLGAEVIDLADLFAVLAPGHRSGITGRGGVRRQGGGDHSSRKNHCGHKQGKDAFHKWGSSLLCFSQPGPGL